MRSADRPLSPHLQIYRWQLTSVLSILHRAAGVALSAGAILLVWWLVAAASGPDAYENVADFLGSWLGLLLLFGWTPLVVLPFVQRDPASRLGYRSWPRPQIHLCRRVAGRRGDRRIDIDRLDRRDLQLGLLRWRQRGCVRRSAARSVSARRRKGSNIGGFSASPRWRWCRSAYGS